MTLLANESPRESAAILSKYNKPKAKNHADLEVKLAELYYEQPDKVQFEKELAEIHPHKKWLMRTLNLVDEVKAKDDAAKKSEEIVVKESCISSRCHDENCPIHGNKSTLFTNFTGVDNNAKSESTSKDDTMKYVVVLGAIGIVAATLIIVSKNIK